MQAQILIIDNVYYVKCYFEVLQLKLQPTALLVPLRIYFIHKDEPD